MGIPFDHLEWAPVARLEELLVGDQRPTLNVTRTYAAFTAIVLWTRERTWMSATRGNGARYQAENAVVSDLRTALRGKRIGTGDWMLSTHMPANCQSLHANSPIGSPDAGAEINLEFKNNDIQTFMTWLRNALAHGDGRTVFPIAGVGGKTRKPYIAGFELHFDGKRLFLFKSDMIRIGSLLARGFCASVSGQDKYWLADSDLAAIRRGQTKDASQPI